MPIGSALLVFLICLLTTLVASEVLVRGLSALGAKLHLTDGLLGFLTALGADAPEVTSAIAALLIGAGDLGRGVVLGSNLFNLAMLLGLSAVLTGHVRIRRQGLALDGVVAVLTLLVVSTLLLGWLPPVLVLVLLAVLLIPYVVLVGTRPQHIGRLPLPDGLAHFLAVASRSVHEEATKPQALDADALEGPWLPVLLVPSALVAIVLASVGLVKAAVALSQAWHLPQSLVGAVILAGLTSIPNAYTATHLARRGRGTAVVSATVNSNTINLVVGLALPALVLGMHSAASGIVLELAWLLGMTVLGLGLLIPLQGMTRAGGAGLMLCYLAFVVAYLRFPNL